jgi:hypothetical protein
MIESYKQQSQRLKRHTDDYGAFIAGQASRIPDLVFNDP